MALQVGDEPAGLSLGSLLGVAVPLLQMFVIETRSGDVKGGGHGLNRGDLDREQNVAEAAIQTLGAVATVLPWPQYLQLLNRFLKVCLLLRTIPCY